MDLRTSTAVESLLSLGGACIEPDWRPPSPAFSTSSEGNALSGSSPRPAGCPQSPVIAFSTPERCAGQRTEERPPSEDMELATQDLTAPGIVSLSLGNCFGASRFACGVLN